MREKRRHQKNTGPGGKIPGLDYRSSTGAGLPPSSGVEIV